MATAAGHSAVVTRYRRYKAGQKQVLRWLTDTAGRCCDLTKLLHCFSASAANKTSSARGPRKIKIKTHELKVLARVIVDAEPSLTVPESIMKVLQDVIEGRQHCQTWYAAQSVSGDTELSAKNKGHADFIRALQEVEELLGTTRATNASNTAPNTTQSLKKKRRNGNKKLDEVSNLFEYLELEDPITDPLGSAPAVKPKKRTAHGLSAEVVMDNDLPDDTIFALWCYLTDMSDTRTFVRDLWVAYARGDISIPTASVVTETALEMMRRAHQDFTSQYPHLGDWTSIQNFLHFEICIHKNMAYVYGDAPKAPTKESNSDVKPTDLVLPTAGLLLAAFAEGLMNYWKSIPMPNPGLGCSNGKVDPNEVLKPRPITNFEPTLFKMLHQVAALTAYSSVKAPKHLARLGDPASHLQTEFTTALIHLVSLKGRAFAQEIPMWVVFACQICIDIDECTHSDRNCGTGALLEAADAAIKVAEKSVKFFEGKADPAALKVRVQAYNELRALAEDCKAVIHDGQAFDRGQQDGTLSEKDQYRYHKAMCCAPGLNVLPHLGGEIAYVLMSRMHDIGTCVANDQSVIIGLGHLYRVAKRFGLISEVWHDMDFLVGQHSSKRPFLTKTPANAGPDSILRHYLLDLGVEASAFAKNTIPGPPSQESLIKAKRISFRDSEFLCAVTERQQQDSKLGFKRGEVIDVVLASLTARSETKAAQQQQGKAAPSTSFRQHFTPRQLLETLKDHLIADEPRLNFDYASFFQLVYESLMKIIILCFPDAKYRFEQPHEAVYYLLKEAADAEATSTPISQTRLATAATYLQTVVSETGKKFSQEAFSRSSGRIPRDRRPQFLPPDPRMEKDLETLLKKRPGASMGPSRKTIEIFDPSGSAPCLLNLLKNHDTRRFMPQGAASTVIITPQSVTAQRMNEAKKSGLQAETWEDWEEKHGKK